jgi:hypothetical protein
MKWTLPLTLPSLIAGTFLVVFLILPFTRVEWFKLDRLLASSGRQPADL